MKKFQTVCSSSFFINYELLLLHSRCYRLCYQFVTSLLPVSNFLTMRKPINPYVVVDSLLPLCYRFVITLLPVCYHFYFCCSDVFVQKFYNFLTRSRYIDQYSFYQFHHHAHHQQNFTKTYKTYLQ